MKIALVQMLSDSIVNHRSTANRIEERIQKACEGHPDFIVLPECAYPSYMLGSDEKACEEALAATGDLISSIKKLAKQNSVYIVIGLALENEGKLYNAALVFDREGKIINRAYKSNLWHFDEKWFEAGQESSVFETEFGTMGVMVCADGRIPEIAGMLRAKGAKLIIDLVNLVAAAATSEQLSNQQYEFILPARAKENGVYIVACNKCGVEENIVTALGRSFVIDPDGAIIAQCSPDKEETLFVDVDLSQSKAIPQKRPELYGAITQPTESLPISKDIKIPYTMDELNLFTMIVRYTYDSKEEFMEKAIQYIRKGILTYADFLVLPHLNKSIMLTEEMQEGIKRVLPQGKIVALAGYEHTNTGIERSVRFVTNKGSIGKLKSTHCMDVENADVINVFSLTPSIKIAALFDEEADIPEIARVAMLNGADIILCYDGSNDPMRIKTLKTRAAENSMFAVRSAYSSELDACAIFNPAGGQSLTTFISKEHAAVGYINTALSKFKSIVPGTHVVEGRFPEFYKKELNYEQ